MTRVPELSTPRLVLRPITLADAPALAGIYADPEVVRFLTPLDAAGTEAQVAMFVAEWQERGYGIMAVLDRETGRFLGRSGLHYWPRFDEIEAGWVLHRDTWGNGYATEAGAATLRWAFEDLGLDLVTAIVARANAASIAVTRRLGMSPLRDDVVNDCPVTVFAARAPRAAGKMHADEIDVSAGLVSRLLAAQLPHWADLPVERVPSPGTDNAIFRLGDAMCVRVPRIPGAAEQVAKEQRWLPYVGAAPLPLAVPTVLATGKPDEGYPWTWSVYDWLPGTPAAVTPFEQMAAARDLAAFVLALREVDATGGPAPGSHNFGRGVPLADRDAEVRRRLSECEGIDTDAAATAWESALAAPAYEGPPLWLHGDLNPWNLLVDDGRVTGVIDFGGLGVGDPATDLLPAWLVLEGAARDVFREATNADYAAWERGRGWALSMGVMALPYYRVTNPTMATLARRAIDAVLA